MMLYDIKGLKKIYGERTVLDIHDLELEQGKIYTLTGPNGAGKTTLLKILALLNTPTAGVMKFLEKKVQFSAKGFTQQRQSVVLLDQNPIMFTGSVRNNVGYGLKVRKVGRKEREKRVFEMLDLVGLSKLSGNDGQALSGGETKRVALARALAVDPQVLICDEPSANVDKENQEIILDTLARINKERGTSIIFSTHYLSQGHRFADKALLLQNGSLSDLLNENIYRSWVIEKNAETALCQLSGRVLLQVPVGKLEGASEVKIWIDPAAVHCSLAAKGEQKKEEKGNSLSGHLLEVGRHNSMVRLSIDAGVQLVIHVSYDYYRKMSPLVGDKLTAIIPDESIRCTSI